MAQRLASGLIWLPRELATGLTYTLSGGVPLQLRSKP